MRAKRVDKNHAEIVKLFRDCGCSVCDLSAVGGGVPDILIGMPGDNILIEIKDGSKPPSKQRLNNKQKQWHMEWPGPCFVVHNVDEALSIMRAYGRVR